LMLVACGPGESLLEEVDDGLYRNPPGLLMTVRPTVVGMRHVPWVKLMFVRTMDSLSSEPSYLHLCIADGGTTVGNRMQKGDDRASRVSPSLLRSRVFFFSGTSLAMMVQGWFTACSLIGRYVSYLQLHRRWGM
jgi:hypothetical protein